MKAHGYLIIILNLTTALSAMEPEPAMVTLVSSDGKEFTVPLEIAEKSEYIRDDLLFEPFRKEVKFYFDGRDDITITGEVLAEVAQLMRALYQYKNLTQKQALNKIEASIPIKDNYAFSMAVKSLGFEPGIAFISKKYAQTRDYSFPKDGSDYWMRLIQEVSPKVYKELKECEEVSGKSCLEIGMQGGIEIKPGKKTNGYPIMVIDPIIQFQYRGSNLKDYLKSHINDINDYSDYILSKNERMFVLDIIKSFAPQLYEEIVAIDPNGYDHIARDSDPLNAEASLSIPDGFPLIRIGSGIIGLPIKWARFIIAHELGHYALEHLSGWSIKHPALQKPGTLEFKKGKKVSGQLPLKESFQHAYTRILEFEADRFAVMELGVSIDDAIAWRKERALTTLEPESPISRETFKRAHPLSHARIDQLEGLRREVELRKAQNRQPKPINWKELAERYRQRLKKLGLA
jgi:hypothetical protein